jgi:prepilin-type N-terminal cleavage/methylation domain-containing protein
MVALVVLSIGILAVAQLFPAGSRGQVQDKMISTANYYCQQKIEELMNVPWSDTRLDAGRHPAVATERRGARRMEAALRRHDPGRSAGQHEESHHHGRLAVPGRPVGDDHHVHPTVTMRTLHATTSTPERRMRGFTMIELMITLTVLAVVMIVLSTVMYTAARSKVATSNRIESSQSGRVALDMMGRDLRSAGYDVDLDYSTPQPPIAYIDSTQVLINENMLPYPDTTGGGPSAPLALNPSGNPIPKPLISSAWTPPIRYRTGAETIRWTLDINNDGAIDGGDLSAPAGVDAQRTQTPTTTCSCARSTAIRPRRPRATTAAARIASRSCASRRPAACRRCSPCT